MNLVETQDILLPWVGQMSVQETPCSPTLSSPRRQLDDHAAPLLWGQPLGSLDPEPPLLHLHSGVNELVSGLQWSAESCRHGLGPWGASQYQTGPGLAFWLAS